jgi:hypothetical protein
VWSTHTGLGTAHVDNRSSFLPFRPSNSTMINGGLLKRLLDYLARELVVAADTNE